MMPRHIAIIMDGNGRWARKRGLPRVAGHKAGLESVRAVIRGCLERKIKVLTLFAFSTENWERSQEEVSYLVGQLFVKALAEEVSELHKKDIRLMVIGELEKFGKKLQQKIREAEELTVNNVSLQLVIALSYSGRWDITRAVRELTYQVASKEITTDEITVERVGLHLCLHDLPEPDLLIRTSGEMRLSNFMLWQLAYAELYFTNVLWPDFREQDLFAALDAYQGRSRRFGKC